MKHDIDYVIAIGEELFRTQGYHHTGTEIILKKSNYPRSSFYHHFKSKEGFAIRVLKNYESRSVDFYSSILLNQDLGNPMQRLKNFTEIFTKEAKEKNFKSECLIQKFSIECAGINEIIRVSTNRTLRELLLIIEKCIVEGQSKKEIRNDIDAGKIAEYFHAQLYGAFILSRLQNDIQIMKNNMDMVIDYIKR